MEFVPFESLDDASFQGFQSYEYHKSGFFWHECVRDWQKDQTHKVYVLLKRNNKEILGFFSIIAKEIVYDTTILDQYGVEFVSSEKKAHIPIIDVPVIGLAENYETNQLEKILIAIMEYIEVIAFRVADQIACRFIRCYIPHVIEREKGDIKAGNPLQQFFLKAFTNKKYFLPPITEKKRRKIEKEKTGKKQEILYLRYYLRDLKVA